MATIALLISIVIIRITPFRDKVDDLANSGKTASGLFLHSSPLVVVANFSCACIHTIAVSLGRLYGKACKVTCVRSASEVFIHLRG